MEDFSSVFAAIMAGGQGTRFWPKSRRSKPKQFLSIICDETMISNTVNRLIPIIPKENIFSVINRSHINEMKEHTSIIEENIIVEPIGRNTAPCIGLAAIYIQRKDPEGVMVALPADHYIKEEELFHKTLLIAKEVASKKGYLVTLGIEPKTPATGFGYIEKGEPLLQKGSNEVFKVKRFTEKPDLNTASKFLTSGNFLWNSGIFVWKVSTILEEIKAYLPSLYCGLMEIKDAIGTKQERDVISKVYSDIESISIDYGIMEKSNNAVVIPSDFTWNDVGTWSSLDELMPKDEDGNILQGDCIALETRDTSIFSQDKLIITLGIDGIVIVETKDVILISSKNKTQDIKKILERLEEEGLDKYL
jgi:mannose-1-phosphate guanylyltransferase